MIDSYLTYLQESKSHNIRVLGKNVKVNYDPKNAQYVKEAAKVLTKETSKIHKDVIKLMWKDYLKSDWSQGNKNIKINEFAKRIFPQDVGLSYYNNELKFEYFFNDGGLYGHHSIIVPGIIKNGKCIYDIKKIHLAG